jgi:predicted DNA-binding transcriptional regulator YafY
MALSNTQSSQQEVQKLVALSQANYASQFYEHLANLIIDFDSKLDNEHEVGVRLVNFGQTVVFSLEDMRYCDPSLISFIGRTQEGQPVELIQHVNQISILLMKLPRQYPAEPKKPIGFRVEERE